MIDQEFERLKADCEQKRLEWQRACKEIDLLTAALEAKRDAAYNAMVAKQVYQWERRIK